jgi:hypothetical protein
MNFIKYLFKKLSNILYNIILSIKWIWIQFVSENFKNYLKNISFEKKEMAILANGPSLIKDLEKLENIEDKELCVVNNFSVSEYFLKLRPKIYVLTDPSYFNENIRLQVDHDAMQALKIVSWKMYLFIPFYALSLLRKRNDSILLNCNINIVPFHINEYKGFDFFKDFLTINSLTMPRPQNVLIPCIFNAINLNFNRIYLLGVDHTWTEKLCVDDYNRVCFRNEHFYDTTLPEYIPFLDIYGRQYEMHQILNDFSLMFKGYSDLNKYAKKKGVKILNLTAGSFIDSFERY